MTTPVPTPVPTVDEDVQTLLKAIAAGPTSGPWRAGPLHPARNEATIRPTFRGTDKNTPRQAFMGFRPMAVVKRDKRLPAAEAEATAQFIAACSPDRIARLLERLQQLESGAAPAPAGGPVPKDPAR